MKKFVCKNCGAVNEASDEDLKSSDDWLECDLSTGFEWTLPVGKIIPIIGDLIYVSGQGENLSRSAYLDKYNVDPELALKLMRLKIGVQKASNILDNQNLKIPFAGSNILDNQNLEMPFSGTNSGIRNSWMASMMGSTNMK